MCDSWSVNFGVPSWAPRVTIEKPTEKAKPMYFQVGFCLVMQPIHITPERVELSRCCFITTTGDDPLSQGAIFPPGNLSFWNRLSFRSHWHSEKKCWRCGHNYVKQGLILLEFGNPRSPLRSNLPSIRRRH